MRTLHKLTHRPLALMALFVGLGVLGWQLPSLGAAVLAYSSSAVKAARATISSTPTASQPVRTSAHASVATATAPAAVAQSSISQQLEAARAAYDAAVAAARASNTKENNRAVEVARAEVNRLSALRVNEIKGIINSASQNQSNAAARTDSGTAAAVPNYAALVAEMRELGGFDPIVNAPAPNTIAETEPNNTSATANTLNVSQLAIATGAVSSVGDLDFYKFTAPANSKVWIYVDTGGTLVAGTRDSFVDLVNTDGSTVIEGDDDDGTSNGGDGTVETGLGSAIAGRTLTTAGTYFVRVRGFGVFPGEEVVNPYRVFVVVTTAATTTLTETEPNDTGATGNAFLTTAQTTAIMNGTVANGAVDFYTVTVNANDTLYVNLDGDPERDGTGTDVALALRNAAGATPSLVNSDSINAGSVDDPPAEDFSFTFATGGTYTLRVAGFGGQGTYSLMGTVVAPAQVCPPTPITSNLGVAGGNFPKTSGSLTQRLNRDGVVSSCGVARTQNAPIVATRTFDKYSITNTGAAPACVFISLTVNETAASNYQVGAFTALNPADLTSGWLGDSGLSSGIPPTVQSFSVNVPAGSNLDVVVFNANATGDGNSYSLTILGFPTCPPPPPCGITCPANVTANVAAGTCAAAVTFATPTTTGVCASGVTCTPASGSSFPKGVTTVTCTGASLGGQAAGTCSFTVTVVDNEPPTLVCPPNQFAATATGAAVPVAYPAPTATDNCPGVGAVTCVPASGSSFPQGVTTVTCTVTDAVNLTSTCAFTVTVNRLNVGALSDPLACTGPGNVVNGFFTVTNTGAVTQNVAATVSTANPPNNLLALPGTCVVTPAAAGTCTVVNNNTITFTGSLAAAASATVSYKLQVNEGAPSGTPVSTTVTASFNGGPNVTASASITPNCPPPGPGAPILTQNGERLVVSDQRPGSVLIYPIYTSDASGGTTQNARISITNTSMTLTGFVHLFFVDGATCSVSDAFLCLTANQTATFLTSDLDPGTTGYLVAIATNANGCPTNFNYLIGDAFVKFSSGHQANLAAEAIAAISGSGFFATCDGTQPTATLRFNGADYGWAPYTLAADSVASTADGNNTLLIIDRIGGDLQTGPSRLGPIFGVLYDDTELSYSFNLPTNNLCQFRGTLSDSLPRTTPRFSQVIPAGRTGWMKFAGTSDFGIVGAIINLNSNSASSSNAFNGGHNLHKLTFSNTMTYTIPVFPPTC